MRLNSKKTISMVVSRSRTIAPSYCDLTLGGAKLEELKSLRILRVTLGSKLTFEIHLREVMSTAVRSLGVMRPAGKLFECPRVLNSCFNAYIFPAYSIVPPCGRCRWSLVWCCWIVLFTVRKGCMRVSFVVWGTEGRLVPCVCSMKFITEGTTI